MTVLLPNEVGNTPADLSPERDQPRLFNRPPRILRTPPADEVEIPGPPQAPPQRMVMPIISIIIPLASSLIFLVFALIRSSSGGSLLMSIPIVLLSLISAGAAYYTYRTQQKTHREAERVYRESYTAALEATRQRLQSLETEQRQCYDANDPDLAVLLQIVQGAPQKNGDARPAERLWERRSADADYLCLRIGRGDRPTSLTIKPPSVNAYSKDVDEPLRIAAQFQLVRNVPVSVNLKLIGSLGIAGPSARSLDVLRALLWQVAVHHAPGEVRIAAFWDSAFDDAWEWLRWLPHTRSLDGDETYRLLARYDRNPEDIQQVLAALTKEMKRRAADEQASRNRPHVIIILSDYHLHSATYPQFAQFINGRGLDVSAICLTPEVRNVPGECGGYIALGPGGAPDHARLGVAGSGGGYLAFRGDTIDKEQSNRLARLLASVEMADTDGGREMPRNVPLLPLLQIDDALCYDPAQLWKTLPKDSWHPVPVGRQSADADIMVDLNESMHGVHGMIAGATGAGKSELLLSFLMALAIKHNPDRLNFMLIDFKGGATFRDLEKLPHTAGFVTDLSGFLAERALIAMNSELDRRKRLLNSKGVPNIRSYRRNGLDRPGQHLPNLMIVIDEFDEMIRDYPDFQVELIRVAKQGRSLGVHLLFATQQPSLIKEGLRNNLSYWMSLRVNSREDSREMVGLPDAALLGTDTPGRGYFRDKNSGVRLFQSALITAPYRAVSGHSSREVDVTGRVRVNTDETRARQMLYGALDQLLEDLKGALIEQKRRQVIDAALTSICNEFNQIFEKQLSADEQAAQRQVAVPAVHSFLNAVKNLQFDPAEMSETQAIEHQIADAAQRILNQLLGEREQISEIRLIARHMITARGECYAAQNYPIWTEPLPELLPLAELLPDGVAEKGWLNVPFGLIDQPEAARRLPLMTDLAGVGGNLLVLGASGSGKTVLLQTVILGLANTHSPGDLWLYLVDSTGGGLGLHGKLPHIAHALAPRQHLLVERLMSELQEQLEARRSLFQQYGVANLSQYRERQRTAPDAVPALPALLVAIDNWAELKSQNETVEELLKTLLREGRSYGVFFIATAYAVRDVGSLIANFETRLALRLNSEDDSSQIIGKDYASKLIKPDQPGRGFVRGSPRPLELQVALPTLRRKEAQAAQAQGDDTVVVYSDLNLELTESAQRVSARWQEFGRKAASTLPRELRLLPPTADMAALLETLPATTFPELHIPLGIDGSSLARLPWNLEQTAHLLIAGGLRSGKGSLLRSLLAAMTMRATPAEVELMLIDFSLRGLRSYAAAPHTRPFNDLAVGKELRDVTVITEKEELLPALKLLTDDLVERNRRMRQGEPLQKRTILAIYNWDLLAQDNQITTALGSLETYARRGGDLGLHGIVTSADFGSSSMGLIRSLRSSCAEIILGRPPDNSSHLSVIRTRFKAVLASDMPPGRGFLLESGQPARVVQFGYAAADLIGRATTPPAPEPSATTESAIATV